MSPKVRNPASLPIPINNLDKLTDKKILVIDDDPDILSLTGHLLATTGASVQFATSGTEGVRLAYSYHPGLIILDVMMPGMDGWETLSHIKAMSDVPVILLTVLQNDDEIIRGFENGAVDYITKPFSNQLFLARLKMNLQQGNHRLPPASLNNDVYDDGFLCFDLPNRQVSVNSVPISLTAKEFNLLAYLAQAPSRIHTFRQILDNVWGWEYRDSTQYVHVYISRLRRKIERDSRRPIYLLTEHGVGYQFNRQHMP